MRRIGMKKVARVWAPRRPYARLVKDRHEPGNLFRLRHNTRPRGRMDRGARRRYQKWAQSNGTMSPVAIKDNNVEVRLSEVGDMTVSFIRFRQGADLGPALAGLPDDLCPCPHWGYMFRGGAR